MPSVFLHYNHSASISMLHSADVDGVCLPRRANACRPAESATARCVIEAKVSVGRVYEGVGCKGDVSKVRKPWNAFWVRKLSTSVIIISTVMDSPPSLIRIIRDAYTITTVINKYGVSDDNRVVSGSAYSISATSVNYASI